MPWRRATGRVRSRKLTEDLETYERMSKRLWLLGLVGLVLVALLVACGSSYNSSSNGLVLVGSQGSSVIQTYSFDLNSGHMSPIANSTNDTGNQVCLLNGLPAAMVTDPQGQYLYVVLNSSNLCPNATQTGIASFQIKSDGTVIQVGSLVPDPNPVSLSMDSAGKFLFVAEGTAGLANVYAIGSGGTLTPVQGTYNFVNGPGFINPNIVAVAASPTVFPGTGLNGVQNAVCSVPENPPPTSEYLYAVDANNYVVWEFSVDTSTGALGNPPGKTVLPNFPTDAVPAGVAVDPCDRFVYISGSLHNKINAYTICTQVMTTGPCFVADGSLVDVVGSPFSTSGSTTELGPIVVDPFGNNVYVVGTTSNTVSGFKISPVSGSITALTPPTVATGVGPKSIVIRKDGSWMFVTNYGLNGQGGNTLSQYSVTPATGALNPVVQAIQTDNYPFGVAVK
jgi:6-phosphogluconolactonase (cycloisomerase 2 family)